jgi:hypothetical protein
MTKYLEIDDDGFVWRVPLQVIAEKRADYYADDPDSTREQEIAFVMDDNFEGIDWYENNMDFEDIAEHAKLVRRPEEKKKPRQNADVEIVEVKDE